MTKQTADANIDHLPEARVERKRGRTVPAVWLIPIIAALVGGWLVVKGILEKGPTITVTFKNAEALEAGKTKITYKNVDVGEVKSIKLSPDREGIVVTAELVKDAASYLVADTRFWVVRPRIAGGQVSGLGTLFSGAYIGMDIGKSATEQREFVGLEVAPIVTADVPGRHFVLHAETSGALQIGSPVYFRQEAVGTVVAHELNKDGRGVTFNVFINAPYDRYVTSDARFWNSSGIDVSLDAGGIKVDTQSIAAILIGGIAFESLQGSTNQAPASEDQEFFLANTRAEAMKRQDVMSRPFVLHFAKSLRGLSVGAPVEFRGIVVGEVKSLNVEIDDSFTSIRFPVYVDIYPRRLLNLVRGEGPTMAMDEASLRTRWNGMVAKGLRGQLQAGNLLTGQLYIGVDFFPDVPAAHIDWANTPPDFPTISGGFEEFEGTLSSIVKKIDSMPLNDIAADVRHNLKALNRTLDSADRFIRGMDQVSPTAKSALDEARKTLKLAERTLSTDSPVQYELQETLRELGKTAQSLRLLTDYLERHPESVIRGKKDGDR
ncbi:MAG: MCE family protein [Nitrospira sp.]|nr:MCE family protein [Nitrospira sp.]